MKQFIDQLTEFFENSPNVTFQIGETVVIILVLWIVRFLSLRLVQRNVENQKTVFKWRKNLTYITVVIGAILLAQIWFTALDSLGTFLGLLTAGIAIALKEPVADVAAWFYILWRKPFDIGDRIQIGDAKGDVIDLRVFKFSILEIGNWVDADQSTGRVIHVPNHNVFTEDVANYTADFEFIWNEIGVYISFESNWKKAKSILQDIVNENMQEFVEQARQEIKRAEKAYLIRYQYLTPIVYTSVKDRGINLTIRFLTNPRKRRGISQAIWEAVLERFAEHDDINFAYPTIRYYDHPSEGKPGMLPENPS